MKTKRTILLISMLTLLLVVSGCGGLVPNEPTEPTVETGTITGKVVVAGTDNIISGAKVTISDPVKSVTTDIEGKYSISELEYGTYTLVVSKDGFVEKSLDVKLDQDTVTKNIELEEKLDSEKKFVQDVSTAMYDIGTMTSAEETALTNDLNNNIMPYFQDMEQPLMDLGEGVRHIEILNNLPGEYELAYDEYGYPYYKTISTSDTTGSTTTDTWIWTVTNPYNSTVTTYTANELYKRMTLVDEVNNVYELDLMGITIDCTVNNTTFSITTGTDSSTTYTIYDGYDTINVIAPTGTIGEATATIPDPTGTAGDITVDASFTVTPNDEDNIKTVSLEGLFTSPAGTFEGSFMVGFSGTDMNFDFTSKNGLPFAYVAQGTLTSSTGTTLSGLFGVVADGDIPTYLELQGLYDSNQMKVEGLLTAEWLNYQEFMNGTADYEDVKITLDGKVTNKDNEEDYSLAFVATTPEVEVLNLDITLSHNDSPYLNGDVTVDIYEGTLDMVFTNIEDTKLTINIPPTTDTEIVGSIVNKDGNKLGDVKFSTNMDALIIIYNDGTTETLPFNPYAYLDQQ